MSGGLRLELAGVQHRNERESVWQRASESHVKSLVDFFGDCFKISHEFLATSTPFCVIRSDCFTFCSIFCRAKFDFYKG